MTAYLISECQDGNFGAWAIEYDGLHLYHEIVDENTEYHKMIPWDDVEEWNWGDEEHERYEVSTKEEVDAYIFERRL